MRTLWPSTAIAVLAWPVGQCPALPRVAFATVPEPRLWINLSFPGYLYLSLSLSCSASVTQTSSISLCLNFLYCLLCFDYCTWPSVFTCWPAHPLPGGVALADLGTAIALAINWKRLKDYSLLQMMHNKWGSSQTLYRTYAHTRADTHTHLYTICITPFAEGRLHRLENLYIQRNKVGWFTIIIFK